MASSYIRLTATNQEGEPHRLTRLAIILGAVAERLTKSGPGLSAAFDWLLTRVESLDDHKGELTVRWKSEPSLFETSLFEHAWSSIGELAENVKHEPEGI